METWTSFKRVIKVYSKSYGETRAKERRQRVVKLTHDFGEAESYGEKQSIKEQLAAMNDYQVDGARIRAGIKFHESGDRSTAAFFCAHSFTKRKKVKISSLSLPNGTVSADPAVIRSTITLFWGSIFGHGVAPSPPSSAVRNAREASLGRIQSKLSPAQADELALPITLDELNEALSKAHLGSSPGPDGIPIEFYRVFWDFAGPVLLTLTEMLQEGHHLSSPMVESVIVLPQNNECASPQAGDFRPISLCNADYKLVPLY